MHDEESDSQLEGERLAGSILRIEWWESLLTPILLILLYVVYPHIDKIVGLNKTEARAIVISFSILFLGLLVAIKLSSWKKAKQLARLHLRLKDGLESSLALESDIPGKNTPAFNLLGSGLRIVLHNQTRDRGPLDLRESHNYLSLLLASCALLLEDEPEKRTIRCGLLLPTKDGGITPFYVYDPNRPHRQSTRQFGADSLPCRMFKDFDEWADHDNPRAGIHRFIENVDKYRTSKTGEIYGEIEFVRDSEKAKIGCLLCIMLYIKDSRKRRPVGILSFDAEQISGISTQRYEEVLPILRIIYRLILIHLMVSESLDDVLQSSLIR